MYRHTSKGAWTFSMQDHGWQVSDCTAEGLKVIECLLDQIYIQQKLREQFCSQIFICFSMTGRTLILANAYRTSWSRNRNRTFI